MGGLLWGTAQRDSKCCLFWGFNSKNLPVKMCYSKNQKTPVKSLSAHAGGSQEISSIENNIISCSLRAQGKKEKDVRYSMLPPV